MLIPKEHGAYGQIGFPVGCALAVARPSIAAVLLTAGFLSAFLAHEALLVRLGLRGARAQREMRQQATRDGAVFGSLALVALLSGAWLMPPGHRWTLGVPAAAALAVFAFVLAHRERTTAGEIAVAVALAACALPVGTAAGASVPASMIVWLVFAFGYAAATVAVRSTIARQRREPLGLLRAFALAAAAVGPAVVAGLAARWMVPESAWLAAVPLSVLSAVLVLAPPHARHLRRVGWGLIAASAIAGGVLVAVL